MNNIFTFVAGEIVKYLFVASITLALLTLLAWLIIKLLKIKSPIYCHMIWLYTIIAFVILPVIWLHGPRLRFEVLPAAEVKPAINNVTASAADSIVTETVDDQPQIDSSMPISTQEPILTRSNPQHIIPVKTILAGIWFAGSIFMLIRLFVGWYRLSNIVLSAKQVSDNEKFMNTTSRKPKLLLTSQVDSPVCFGHIKPIILLPEKMYHQSSQQDLKMMLSHELAHIERGDCWTNLFQRIIEAFFFFNPFVWFASFQLTQQREQICDNHVLAQGSSVDNYVQLLSRIVEHGMEKNYFHAVALFEGRLLSRIRSMLDPLHKIQTKTSRWAIAAGLAVVLTFLVCGTVRLEAQTVPQTEKKQTMDSNDYPIDSNVKKTGDSIRKRITTYADKESFSLKDGQTAEMKVKKNIAEIAAILITPHFAENGTKFDLKALDDKKNIISSSTTQLIHYGGSLNTGIGSNIIKNGKSILSKIQLSPKKQDNDLIKVRVKTLFTELPSWDETKAMLLTRGKEGKVHLDFSEIHNSVEMFKDGYGHYPKTLSELKKPLQKDAYSQSDQDYHFELHDDGFILSSCGKDGVYGTDDDEVAIYSGNKTFSGLRHEVYPLENKDKNGNQKETLHGQRPIGNCSISGKVVTADTNEPVGHAKVYLFYSETFAAMFIDVASDGSFEFKNIPSGEYHLQTTRTAGFQDKIYNTENNNSDCSDRFTLKDGEQRTNVILKVEPAYRISGKVIDENGKLLKDTQLTILAWKELETTGGNGNRFTIAKQAKVTSDGSYLLDGLDGQPVYIMTIDFDEENKDDYYPPCYYPGTVARDEAKKVTFDGARSIDGIDIHLKKEGNFFLEGIVTDDATGKAIPKTLVTIHHRDMLFDRVTTYTDNQGHYEIKCLGSGDFLVHVDAEPWGYVRTRQPVKIDTEKVTKLDFTLRSAAKISGRIIDQDGNPMEISERAYGLAYKEGYPTPERMSWSGVPNKYNAKSLEGHGERNTFNGGHGDYEEEYMAFPTLRTFVIEGMLPGKTILRFHPQSQNQEVKEILYNGQDIKETGIETKPGQEIKDVSIIIGNKD